MKHARKIVPVIALTAILAVASFSVFADEETEAAPTVDVVNALQAVRAQYGAEALILEGEFEAEEGEAGWEFELMTDAGEVEVLVAEDATGALIVTEAVEETDDSDDAEDANEMDDSEEEITTAPTITIEQAISIAQGNNPESPVTEIELENDMGTLVWEVEFHDGTSIGVDAETGALVELPADGDDSDDDEEDEDEEDDEDDD